MHHLTPSFILANTLAGKSQGQFEAVTLFIDTSGFTPLTAHLAQKGRDGAEVLANILLAVFEPLVEAVYAHGGFIAGFAGDAFKAVFPERTPESYLRALATAQQIRTYMVNHPTQVTKYGAFDFQVRLSLADGIVTWAVWSAENPSFAQIKGYTFSGLAFDQAIQGEDYAEGGELVVTDAFYHAALAALPEMIMGKELTGTAAGYYRIGQISDALPVPQPIPIAAAELLSIAPQFFPVTLLTMQAQGEFRPVFSVFVNVQRLADPNDDEDFLPQLLLLLHQYGGYLCRIGRIGANDSGGTFLLFWGAPTSYENDLDRVLNFLLELRSQINIPLRAGVTNAVVYAGFVGSPLREEYTCYGSSVNQAARQMGLAEWGQILLDANTARRAQADFIVTRAGQYSLKGLAGQHVLFSLDDAQVLSETAGFANAFIGRGEELFQLTSAIQPIYEGLFGGLILVSGEAGIGKSRLVHEVIDQQTNAQIMLCQSDEILRESLNPFRHFLRQYFDQLTHAKEKIKKGNFATKLDALIANTYDKTIKAELERTRSFLGAMINLYWPGSLYEQLEPKSRFENSLTALKTLILAESLRQPVMLLLEDVQWLDEDSHLFLAQLTHNVAAYPIAIIATTRPLEGETAVSIPIDMVKQEIILGSLSANEIANLAQEHLGDKLAPSLARLLMQRAEGNPFFAEQILLYLQEQGMLISDEQGWRLIDGTSSDRALPDDVQAVLVARLDRLAQEVKQVVQTAAVLGREFSVQILSQMLRNDRAVDNKIQSAQEAAIWSAISELRYLFRHALLRDAAYEMQLRTQLQSLHKTAAEAIQTLYADGLDAYYPELVHHHYHAGNQAQERIFARLAGEQAQTQYANADAISYLSRALELTLSDQAEDRFELLIARENIYDLVGNREAQKVDLAQLQALLAAEFPKDAQRQTQVGIRLAKYHERVGQFAEATAMARDVLQQAQQNQLYEAQAHAHFQYCIALWRQGFYEEARTQANMALSVAKAHSLPLMEAFALHQLGNSDYLHGRYEEARHHYEQAHAIFVHILKNLRSQSSTLANLGLVAIALGNYASARDKFRQSLAINRQIGNVLGIARGLQSLGGLYIRQYEFDEARTHFEQALNISREMRDRNSEAIIILYLIDLSQMLGDYTVADNYLDVALSLARSLGNRRSESLALMKRGFLNFLQGNPAAALTILQTGLNISQEIGLEPVRVQGLVFLGHIQRDLNQLSAANITYQEALQIYRKIKNLSLVPVPLAGLADVALVMGNQQEALAFVDEILDQLDKRPLDGGDPMRVYLTCYRVLLANRDSRASALLYKAHALLQKYATTIADDNQRQSFLENVAVNREVIRLYLGNT